VSFRRLPTEIDGVVFVEPDVHGDERGFLVETYRAEAMKLVGIDVDFVQENHSRSSARVLRGLHLQRGQAKLVRCARGRIFDVAVDLRPDSPTYKRWEGYDLDDVEHRQLFIPDGFGHGFCVLRGRRHLSSYFDPDLEMGIAWDPDVASLADHGPAPLRSRPERSVLGGPGGFGFGPRVRLGQSPMDDAGLGWHRRDR
jgi:dTDP-4-dehydrorhamnose 3,5-epimerase